MVAGNSSIDNQLYENVGSNDTNKKVPHSEQNESIIPNNYTNKKVPDSEQNESTIPDKNMLMVNNFIRMQKDFMAIQNFFEYLCRIGKVAAKDYE